MDSHLGHLGLPHHKAVEKKLKENNIKYIYVPAGKTSTRQPLDTHIFAPCKRKYQAYYDKHVFIDENVITQLETVVKYDEIFRNIDPVDVKNAFDESIFLDSNSVIPIEKDPC